MRNELSEMTLRADMSPGFDRRIDALSGFGLAVMALAGLAVAVSLLVVIALASGTARAQEAPSAGRQTDKTQSSQNARPVCAGSDLLAKMADSDPARLAGIRRQAADTPNGDDRLWKIEKKGVAPSWLYGTMHVTDPRVLALPDAAAKALAGAQTVVIETIDILDPTKAQAEILAKPDLTMFTDGTTLADHMDATDLALVKDKLKERGLSYGLVQRMKPWMLGSMLAVPACEEARAAAGADFLDEKIAKDAKAEGKTVEGLETLDEQLEALAGLPMKFHIQGLVESLKLGDLMDDVTVTMTDLYLKSRIGTILPMMEAVSPKEDEAPGSGYAEFQKRIITDRDAVMAKRAAPIIDKGNAFIAVGALHLVGKEGVVALLRKAGYTVTGIE